MAILGSFLDPNIKQIIRDVVKMSIITSKHLFHLQFEPLKPSIPNYWQIWRAVKIPENHIST